MATVTSLLTETLQLLEKGFCRAASAENKYGREVPLTWNTATAWSISGAVCRASWNQGVVCFDPRQERAFEALEAVTGSHLGRWEAQEDVTQEMALEVVRRALASLQEVDRGHVGSAGR